MLPALADSLIMVLQVIRNMLYIVVFGSFVCSLLNADPYNPIVRILNGISEPLFRPFRKLTARFNNTGIDFAPMLLLLVVMFTFSFAISLLRQISSGNAIF